MFVITGGGTGIGRALAMALAARHQRVMVVGRQEEALVNTVTTSTLITYHVADLSTRTGRASLVERLHAVSVLDGIIHNAGIIEPICPLLSIREEDWARIMATNVEAPLFLTQALFGKLQHARVLHMGSGAAHWPVPTWAAYCVSKAALSMLTRCWQVESSSMAVTCVMPGIVDTPMQAQIRQASLMDEKKQDFFHQLKQEQRLIACETVAQFLVWLLLDVDVGQYVGQEWDIYDVSHHALWLTNPTAVPALEE